jgi:hypothetical protein
LDKSDNLHGLQFRQGTITNDSWSVNVAWNAGILEWWNAGTVDNWNIGIKMVGHVLIKWGVPQNS